MARVRGLLLCCGIGLLFYGLWIALNGKAIYVEARDKAGFASDEYLISLLQDDRESVRAVVVSTLARRGPDVVDKVVNSLMSGPNTEARKGASIVLSRMARLTDPSELKEKASLKLLDALNDADLGVRAYSALALYRINHEPTQVLPTFRYTWKNGTDREKYLAAEGLTEMGKDATDVAGDLENDPNNPNEHIALWARNALDAIRGTGQKDPE